MNTAKALAAKGNEGWFDVVEQHLKADPPLAMAGKGHAELGRALDATRCEVVS